jgi:Asp-tRNA(Asn)/Glu-tRNA(Gln) amidotransferase A subunit family amidase
MKQHSGTYDPREYRPLTFHDAVPRFREGSDTPRKYLERCLEVIDRREPQVHAWVVMNVEGARAAADESTRRYAAGRPLSPIDGLPIGIKDLFETRDMPTQMGCEAYEANHTHRDAPVSRALREAGAVVLGKTVTTELGMSHPGPTTNPFNPRHTPGGSSSGSGAAVGAGMVPACIGSQVGGSIIRPASYCANHALKPTLGALNRGERLALSQAVIGTHAGCPEDMWLVAMEVARRTGGDPGYPGLFGPADTPTPMKPLRLAVMETEMWGSVDAASRDAFAQLLASLAEQGVEIVRRKDSLLLESFEQSISQAKANCGDISSFEQRWSTRELQERHPGKVSARMLARMDKGIALGVEGYRLRLQQREEARRRHAAIAPVADAMISLSSPGPAPEWLGDQPGKPLAASPTGDFGFNAATSMLGAPAVSVPMLAVNGLPLGVQVVGQWHDDARAVAIARWISQAIAPVRVEH